MSKNKNKQENNLVAVDLMLELGEFQIGRTYHISTVTHAWRGEVVALTPFAVYLKNARLIALTGDTSVYSQRADAEPTEADNP